MIDVQSWMQEAVALLREAFGSRLLFVGLQGSHRRGEARDDSDIDILVVLDTLDLADLAAYRAVLHRLPEGEKAGGFTCGREELLAWPPFELFQFERDTDAWYGDLQVLLPPVTRADIITGARAAVSGLYHFTANLYLTGDAATRANDLKAVYKSFFFAIQLVKYLRHGAYAGSKKELLVLLSGDEADLLRLSMDSDQYEAQRQTDSDALFQRILTWAGKTMRELADFQ